MEFDEMVKIWNRQNNEPLFAINEAALHRRIHAKSRSTGRVAGVNEIGLMIVAVLTGGYLLTDAIVDNEGIYSYLAAIAFVFIGIYVVLGRIRRRKMEQQFDRSILGELDHAISNANYLVSFARTFVFWFLVPAGITAALSMAQSDAPLWKWLMIIGCFPLSYLLVSCELKRVHIPRKRNLESLRAKLTAEAEEA